MSSITTKHVWFVTKDGPVDIRMVENSVMAMVAAAETLKARYFVTIDGYDLAQDCPIWGVFDRSTARKNTPYAGEISIGDPIKTYATPEPDAAIMWAMHRKGAEA